MDPYYQQQKCNPGTLLFGHKAHADIRGGSVAMRP